MKYFLTKKGNYLLLACLKVDGTPIVRIRDKNMKLIGEHKFSTKQAAIFGYEQFKKIF